MAGSVNKVILIGHAARDPETRTFSNGNKVCNLRIATSERWTDKQSGEKRERAEFHSVAIFNENLAKIAEQYVRKGSLLHVEGQLETRKYQDQSGADRYSTEIVLRAFRGELTLLGGKPDGGDQSRTDHNAIGSAREAGGYGGGSGYGAGGRPGSGDLDDTIPFAASVL